MTHYTRSDIASGIEITRAQMLLSERRDGEALKTARRALSRFTSIPADKMADLERVKVLAEAGLGRTRQAQTDADQLAAQARKQFEEELIAEANLVKSIVDLQAHLPDQASSSAEDAHWYFSAKEEKESEWLSLFCIAKARQFSGDAASASANAKKALDILAALEQTWNPQIYHQYIARPDNQLAFRQLVKLASTNGGTWHE